MVEAHSSMSPWRFNADAGAHIASQHSEQSSATALQGDASNAADVSSPAPAAEEQAPLEISWDMDASPETDMQQAGGEPAGIGWGAVADPASAAEPAGAATGISWDVEVEPATADTEASVSWDIAMDPASMGTTEDAAAQSATDVPVDIDWGVEVADEGANGAGDGGGGTSIDWDVGDDGKAGGAEAGVPGDAGEDGSQMTPASSVTACLIRDSDFRSRSAVRGLARPLQLLPHPRLACVACIGAGCFNPAGC